MESTRANLIEEAEANGWGWAVFAWDGSTTGLFDLLSSTGTPYQPAPAGMPILTGLARN